MEEVYGIFNGEYSDWNCLGFFTDELEAEKYCALMNSKNDGCYVVKIDNLTGKVDLSKIKPKYVYLFSESFNDFWSNSQEILCNGHEQWISEVRYTRNDNAKYMITVITTEKNRDKAVKIAQDMFAKYKAEKMGL